MSKFEIAISPSIFQLESRSKTQNIRNAPGYFAGTLNFRHYLWWKSLLRPQNDGHFKNFEIWNAASFWHKIWKDRPKLCQKCMFHGDDVIDDVTRWPQIRSSIFMFGRGSTRASGKDNASSIHVNIAMIFLGYTRIKKISINNTFPILQVKGQRHRLTGWPWHLNDRNSVNLGIMKQHLKCKK